MKLSQVNEILDHKIIDGSEYQWNCWPNARFLDYETEYCHVSVVFNYKTQEIYQAEVTVKPDEWFPSEIKPYRWLDPRFKDAMVAEAEERKTDHTQAWDNVKWVDLETEEDWLNKAEAISIGTGFDERIEVPLELDQDTITRLALEAHKRDITLNNMVEIILQAAIDQHKVNETIDQNVE
jgi:hypothetical protein